MSTHLLRRGLLAAYIASGLSSAGFAGFTAPHTPSFQGSADAEFAGWECFGSAFLGTNQPDHPNTTPGASFDVVQLTPGAIFAGTCNIYSPAGAQIYELSHAPAPGRSNADLATLVLQLSTQGTELDYDTVALEYDVAGGTISVPFDSRIELARSALDGQGFAVETLYQWNLAGISDAIDDYVVRFSSLGAHLSLDAVLVDAYWSDDAVNYCTAGTSASGCQAQITASGTASRTSPSGFHVAATSVEGNKDGLFFYAANGRQANSWGNGTSFQCVVPPVKRGGLLSGSGTPGACDGSFVEDLNARWCTTCPKPSHNPGVGATMQGQLWYRDPANTSSQTTSLSNAVEWVVAP